MDAFYAAVEQRDDPALRGRPVAVGGRPPRGVVMTASYEARPSGVRSAMPSAEAIRRCPDLVFVKPRFDAYKAASQAIRAVFHRYTDLVEPLSLDEAYLDVTEPKRGPPSALLIARRLKAEIYEATGLTASAGVAAGKFIAKVASDLDKPDGLTLIEPADAAAFLAELPIEDFHGIGPVTARKMRAAGIYAGADLQAATEEALVRRFGKVGRFWHRIARGLDERPVRPNRVRKSVGAEKTFGADVRRVDEMEARLAEISARVAERLRRAEAAGFTVTLKIKYADFTVRTRRRTLPRAVAAPEALHAMACLLLADPAPPARPVRLLGLTVSSLTRPAAAAQGQQLTFAFY